MFVLSLKFPPSVCVNNSSQLICKHSGLHPPWSTIIGELFLNSPWWLLMSLSQVHIQYRPIRTETFFRGLWLVSENNSPLLKDSRLFQLLFLFPFSNYEVKIRWIKMMEITVLEKLRHFMVKILPLQKLSWHQSRKLLRLDLFLNWVYYSAVCCLVLGPLIGNMLRIITQHWLDTSLR